LKVRRYTEPQKKDTSEGKSHISFSLPGQEGLVLNVEFKEDKEVLDRILGMSVEEVQRSLVAKLEPLLRAA
jgi:hypothetical protein